MIQIGIRNGVVILNREGLMQHFKNLPDGDYFVATQIINPKTDKEWRNLYFLLRDIVFNDGETGYTKEDIHTIAKQRIIPMLAGDEVNFKDDKLPELSTRVLSVQGWSNFVKEFKILAQEELNCYI